MSNLLEKLMNDFIDAEMTHTFSDDENMKQSALEQMVILRHQIAKEKATADDFF